jgi:TetR/AcrR family transcriptional regulator
VVKDNPSGLTREPRPRTARGRDKERTILREAESQFARYGFEGASLEGIGAAIGISRHALLYYFPSKEALYRAVLDDVMWHWLSGMGELARAADPRAALGAYIEAKLASSRERPEGSRVFTKEVIAGAPHYGHAITARVRPVLEADVQAFERWARAGLVKRVDFRHLIFMIWATTQAYADHAAQFARLLGRPALEPADFRAARRTIEAMVLGALRPDAERRGTL